MFNVDILPIILFIHVLIGSACAALYIAIRHHRASTRHLRAAKLGLFSTIAIAPILAVRIFYWDISITPTGSMMPVIQPGDVMLLDKRAYDNGVMPRRGDIVAFDAPPTGFHEVSRYAKRVLALPGDHVAYTSDQQMVINGVPLARTKVDNPTDDGMAWWRETLGDTSYIIRQPARGYDLPVDTFVVPDGHFYAVGDNRYHSHDSRAFGSVPLDLLVGKATRTIGHIAMLAAE